MRQLYQATSRSARMNGSRGFTLIELLIVIAIIAILASLAIPQYLKYQRKAKVSSYAEPIARGCMMDIAAFCTENPNVSITTASLGNCSSTTVSTAGGDVTLNVSGGTPCTPDGQPPADISVTATLAGITDYTAVCNYTNQSIKCTIKG
ncbi:MAG: prepilin-type N-terminal cleavage/methylation domain-containing protein [Hydrogenobacter sp.]